MTAQSQFIKNGQQFKLASGAAPINVSDLVEIGGPGNEAWTVATADYAGSNVSGTILSQTSVVAAALPSTARQPAARDRLGNIYVAGTNSSGNLVVYKYTPLGTLIASQILDATATSVNTPQLFQIQSGAYVCCYARASGALYFVIFDASLSIVSGPISVVTERASTNVVYHASCALSGGGFAIAFQIGSGTQINLVTFSNTGVSVLAATNIQTLAGTPGLQFLRLGQLSNGNLVCAYRGTMTAGGNGGTSFTIVTVGGANVAGPTNMDNVSTAGFLELNILPNFFALAEANGTSVECGVYTNAGVVQGAVFTVGNTLNSTAYRQLRLTNDGSQFWIAYFSSVGNGVYVVQIPVTGGGGITASGLASATLNASTYALDAEVINGLLVVLACSNGTAGQFWLTIGLPDSSLGIIAPYIRTAAIALGVAPATTGSLAPRVLSGGGGLYTGANPPNEQPVNPPTNGSFTAIFIYDQQNVAGTFIAIQKFESSAVVGVAQVSIAANLPGTPVLVNPGQGDYIANSIGGTNGFPFNHLNATPSGTAGVIYNSGVALAGIANNAAAIQPQATSNVPPGAMFNFPGVTPPSGYLFSYGQAISRTGYAALFLILGTTYGVGDGSTTFNLPDLRGRIIAGPDNMGGTPAFRLGSGANGGFTGAATLATTGGEQEHTQTVPEMPSHDHSANVVTGSNAASTGGPVQGSGASGVTGNTGGGNPMNITQPTILLNVIIKT